MVQHGAAWCRVVQGGAECSSFLNSLFNFVAHLLLKNVEQQMRNKKYLKCHFIIKSKMLQKHENPC
jgi:hypothetical protein